MKTAMQRVHFLGKTFDRTLYDQVRNHFPYWQRSHRGCRHPEIGQPCRQLFG